MLRPATLQYLLYRAHAWKTEANCNPLIDTYPAAENSRQVGCPAHKILRVPVQVLPFPNPGYEQFIFMSVSSFFSGGVVNDLSHFNQSGQAHMVDIAAKTDTHRIAVAKGTILMRPEALERVRAGEAGKGDVLGIARIAAIMGAKRTSDLIPLCHPLPLTHITVDFTFQDELSGITCLARVETVGKTGVEMEALLAVQTGLLTIYDMVKGIDPGMIITHVHLVEKHGGSKNG